jgi:hypothetical protein
MDKSGHTFFIKNYNLHYIKWFLYTRDCGRDFGGQNPFFLKQPLPCICVSMAYAHLCQVIDEVKKAMKER